MEVVAWNPRIQSRFAISREFHAGPDPASICWITAKMRIVHGFRQRGGGSSSLLRKVCMTRQRKRRPVVRMSHAKSTSPSFNVT